MSRKLFFITLISMSLLGACDSKVKDTGSCGDNFLDPGEECDGSLLTIMTCTDLGYYSQNGDLTCRTDCTIDRAACTGRCGDGVYQSEFEECEGTNLNNETCQSRGQGVGILACSETCAFDISGCAAQACGDGVITAPIEDCEGTNLNGETCQTRDYHGGLLRCDALCKFDEEACATFGRCGDGAIQEAYEECEGVNLNDQTCQTLGYYGGTLTCTERCEFVVDDCVTVGRCGDGTVQTGFSEDCDGVNLNGATCDSLGYNGGTLACGGDCRFALASCEATGRCGDGAIDAGFEDCDGALLGGQTCAGLGNFFGGTLSCAGTCVFDEGLCLGVTAVSAGGSHTCALLTNGTIRCWGSNSNGQLGDGTTTQRTAPVAVSGITTAVEVSAGSLHTCARLADGSVKCWGSNGNGQLGDGNLIQRLTPVPVMTGTTDPFGNPIPFSGAASVSAGNSHTCARITDGSLKCWGYNSVGQLGDGTTTTRYYPVAVAGITTASEVSAGGGGYGSHTCARLNNGTVQCWGYNSGGQLGDGTTTNRNAPVQVTGITTAVEVSTGQETNGNTHTCARLADGTLRCWGYNGYGQLGDGTNTQRLTPVQVTGITTAVSVAAGSTYTCSMLTDNTVKCWGYNSYGQLGNETTTSSLTPVTVLVRTGGVLGPQNDVVTLEAGVNHNCLILINGVLKCWGYNSNGQLGDGTTGQRTTPTPVVP